MRVKPSVNDRFTLVVEFRGGTYVSQFLAPTPGAALRAWLGSEAAPLGSKAMQSLRKGLSDHREPVSVQGVVGVWCETYSVGRDLVLINIVETK